MWDKPEHCRVTGISRPVRVAYLVDITDCPDVLLDRVFAEAYSRWGGRRTAIIPATATGIDDCYVPWLHILDPDIIYSFVDLDDATVEDIHERFAPSSLIKHYVHNAEKGTERAYRVALPFPALSSFTVIPAHLSRPDPFGPAASRLQVLDADFGHANRSFVEENFGLFSSSFATNLYQHHGNTLAPLMLIARDALAHQLENPNAIYVHDERDILAACPSSEFLGQRAASFRGGSGSSGW